MADRVSPCWCDSHGCAFALADVGSIAHHILFPYASALALSRSPAHLHPRTGHSYQPTIPHP